MEDQDSVGKQDEGPDTEVDKLDKSDAKLGQFSDRFEKIESAILALSSQLSSQDKRPVAKGYVEPERLDPAKKRTQTPSCEWDSDAPQAHENKRLARENLHPKSNRGQTRNRAQMEKF